MLNFFSHVLSSFTDLGEEGRAGPPWMGTDPSGPRVLSSSHHT